MFTCKSTSACLEKCGAETADKIRNAPIQSVLIAGAVGFLLRYLPVFAIVGGILRVARALLCPALVVFGIIKITQCLRAKPLADSGGDGVSDREFPRPVTTGQG